MIENITFGGEQFAIIVRATYSTPGISFVTSPESSQQLAFMKHARGKVILPHVHNSVKREIYDTNEVLVIRSGRLRVDFYTQQKEYLESRILDPNDVLILFKGGHGFEVLEDLEMFEVKQGPFAGENDKVKFEHISETKINYK